MKYEQLKQIANDNNVIPMSPIQYSIYRLGKITVELDEIIEINKNNQDEDAIPTDDLKELWHIYISFCEYLNGLENRHLDKELTKQEELNEK